MQPSNKFVLLLIIPLIIMSFFQCASTQKFQDKMPLEIGEVYYKNLETGYQIYIPIKNNPNNISIDSIYFKGQKTKLEASNDNLYIGHFKTVISKSQDIIMSSDPIEEYGNKVPELPKKIPFDLNDEECVISYLNGNKVNYFKIHNIIEKDI